MNNCENIQDAIDNSLLGILEKEERFMGHVTIARVRSFSDRKLFLEKIKKIRISKKLSFQVKSFELRKSTLTSKGPMYETIEEYALTS